MEELLDIHDAENNFVATMPRKEFYEKAKKEYLEKGEVSFKVKTIRMMLLNSHGRVYIQKRSTKKKQNAGRYDKTIGGHITSGHTVPVTLVKECAEELGIPAVMLDENEFAHAIKSTDLSIIGIFKKIEYDDNFISLRIIDGEDIRIPYITTFLLGYYNGAIKFYDGEASGIEVFEPVDLRKDLEDHPEKYTEDLQYMISKFGHMFVPVSDIPDPVNEI